MVKCLEQVDLALKTPNQRKEFLQEKIKEIPDFGNISKEFQLGKKLEKLLKSGLQVQKIVSDKSPCNQDLKIIFEKFKINFISEISEKLSAPNPSVYTVAETPVLKKANTFTRSFSTKLGEVWEDIAFLSPKIISTEKIFDNFKVKGVDVIICDNDEFCFCQIKTMKGTLTGSQVPRSEDELKIYEKSSLVAALDLGRWTFNSSLVPRIAGKEFWDLLEIDYDKIIENTKDLMSCMEEYIKDDNKI